MVSRREHWEAIYQSKSEEEMSWTQSEPLLSLKLIGEACSAGRVIDVGGGISVLAERLVDRGYRVAVLDISEAALERGRRRLGDKADRIEWMAADITAGPELGSFNLWHDRAVFHFLTAPEDRQAYKELLLRTIPAGGHVVIGAFAPDGPLRCSGLDVVRYDGPILAAELGAQFTLLKSEAELHFTPAGKQQSFRFSLFRRI
ncbi:MAG: class I SAM-dependent methyltransferase [Terracidiphilus sp.]